MSEPTIKVRLVRATTPLADFLTGIKIGLQIVATALIALVWARLAS